MAIQVGGSYTCKQCGRYSDGSSIHICAPTPPPTTPQKIANEIVRQIQASSLPLSKQAPDIASIITRHLPAVASALTGSGEAEALVELRDLCPDLKPEIRAEYSEDYSAVYINFYRREEPQAGLRVHDGFGDVTLPLAMQKVREWKAAEVEDDGELDEMSKPTEVKNAK